MAKRRQNKQDRDPRMLSMIWHDRQKEYAQPLKDRFPGVAKVVIKTVTVPEAKWHGEPEESTMIFRPQDLAFFRQLCQWRDCIRGGFELGPVVNEMVEKGEAHRSGEDCCRGNLNNAASSICLLGLNYTIDIDYLS